MSTSARTVARPPPGSTRLTRAPGGISKKSAGGVSAFRQSARLSSMGRSMPEPYATLGGGPQPTILPQIVICNVLAAMHPTMTGMTERDEILHVKAQRWVLSPRLEMVGMKRPAAFLHGATAHAAVVVPCVDRFDQRLPLARGIQALSFWTAPGLVVGIFRASHRAHAIPCAAQIRFGNRGFLAQNGSGFFCVAMALKRILYPWLAHVVVLPTQILPTRACRNPRGAQLSMHPGRVMPHHLCNVVSRKTLNQIFLSEPCRIKRGKFLLHTLILTPNKAKC